MQYDVISIGSATLDVFIKSPDFQISKTDQVFSGQALIMPYGAKCEVSQLLIQSGGGGTNTAVGFSRLGLRSAVLGRCGTDFSSEIIKEALQKEKVTSLLIQTRGDKTDYSTILIGPDGDRTILVYRGETKLEEDLINWEKLQTSWFYISSVEGNLKLLRKILEFAHKNKIKIAFNPGRKELSQKEALVPILNQVEVVIVNREEAAFLTGLSLAEERLFMATCLLVKEIAVITDSARGATLCNREERILVSDGFKVQAAASTGAGDGFGCGFIAGLIMGWGLEESLKLGICNGAAVVTKIGAKTGLLHQPEEVEEWMKKPLRIGWRPKNQV